MRNVIPKKLRCSVYHSIINSQFSYAISTWGGSESNLKHIFILQKRALRNLFGIKKVSKFIKGHTKEVFAEYKILTVYNVYNYMTLLQLSKLILLKEPKYLCKLLSLLENATLRHNRLPLPKLSLKHYKSNFCYTGPRLWNALNTASSYCNNIAKAPTISCFKSRLKKTLLQMQTYGDKIDWIPANQNIYVYLTAIQSDPYYVT